MQGDRMARTGQTDKTDRLISSDKVDGTSVYNKNGANLGSIDHLMIDKFSGQVEYAVMSTGGFLGIGESYSHAEARGDAVAVCGERGAVGLVGV